jgi:predicted ATPase
MPVSEEIRRLDKKWRGGTAWPRRLEWVAPDGLRGWQGFRIRFSFPIVGIVGENGSGKSTILQAAACAYQGENGSRTWYPTEFFPITAWDHSRKNVSIAYGYMQGDEHKDGAVRKLTTRWLNQTERPKRRVEYIDLNRIQPVGARVGYARIAKTKHVEKSSTMFQVAEVERLSSVMGRTYDSARMALSNIDDGREVPVIARSGYEYSGFHQGSGEITVAELIRKGVPKYCLLLIDDIESSLHPRSQRRLIRDLAEQCRIQEAQVILTTHSPYVLEELPVEARMYILEGHGHKSVVAGISPQFAMTKMDDDIHPECDLYVEDSAAQIMLEEILTKHNPDAFVRCDIVPYGGTNVGHSLGQMVNEGKFKRPTRVFIDGDSAPGIGCIPLPGGDAPEQVVFKTLRSKAWGDLWTRIGRDISLVEDACSSAMTLGDHHDWVRIAANKLRCGGEPLWRAMCAEWAMGFPAHEAQKVITPVLDALA